MVRLPEFSLILPCYNEAEHFRESAKRIIALVAKLKIPYEIIFVEDVSCDNTKELLADFISKNKKLPLKAINHAQNTGRGGAVADGIKAARGISVGFMDIDCEISPEYIERFLMELGKGADVVYGVRHYAIDTHGLTRALASKIYSYLVRLILGTKMMDTEAGFKFFKRGKILPILQATQSTGWFWDTEIMMRGERAGLKIVPVPVEFVRRTDKTSTVHLVSDSLMYFLKLLTFRVHS